MPPFDGAARLIRRAQAAGMSVAVASSGAPAKIHHNLSSAGLLPLLPPHVLVSAAHVAAGKPAPDVYLRAMEVTGGCLGGVKAKRTSVHRQVLENRHSVGWGRRHEGDGWAGAGR